MIWFTRFFRVGWKIGKLPFTLHSCSGHHCQWFINCQVAPLCLILWRFWKSCSGSKFWTASKFLFIKMRGHSLGNCSCQRFSLIKMPFWILDPTSVYQSNGWFSRTELQGFLLRFLIKFIIFLKFLEYTVLVCVAFVFIPLPWTLTGINPCNHNRWSRMKARNSGTRMWPRHRNIWPRY